MKKLLSTFIIMCLVCSIMPFGLELAMPKEVRSAITLDDVTTKVHYTDTTINMSTACKPVRMLCKILAQLKKTIKNKITIIKTIVSRKLTETKGTHYRKIITFENNGEEDPSII